MIHNNFQANFNYGFGYQPTPSYAPAAPVYQQPSIQPYHFDQMQAQQTLFQGWAGFGGGGIGGGFGGGFSASAGASASFGGGNPFGGFGGFGGGFAASAGASASFGANPFGGFGGGFSASAGASASFGGGSPFGGFGSNSTDLSSVFGSLNSMPSFGLAGGNDPFASGLQQIESRMFALAGNFGSGGPIVPSAFNNPFSARLNQIQQQLVNLAFTPQPAPQPFFF
jgi:hypothetical protein